MSGETLEPQGRTRLGAEQDLRQSQLPLFLAVPQAPQWNRVFTRVDRDVGPWPDDAVGHGNEQLRADEWMCFR
jgi:hypothetical protein